MNRTACISALAAISLLAATPAAAQTPAPKTTPKKTAAKGPAPRMAQLAVTPQADAVLVRSKIRVRGTLIPYVKGQKVTVRFYRGTKKLRAVSVKVRQDGKVGRFTVGYAPRRTGSVTVRASHRATAAQKSAVARGRSVSVLPRRVGTGSRGPAVRVLQNRLAKLGYVVGRRGVFDGRTARAVVAFRKVTGMARTAQANEEVFAKLSRGGGAFRVKFPKHGRHIEADISRQVLALIGANGKVERIYPTSTGAPATPTILGSYRVYRKDLGTNAKGMVHSSYFIRGYAIHGYQSVPTYNASHGCLRVPVPDAMSIFRWVRYGTRVDTYR